MEGREIGKPDRRLMERREGEGERRSCQGAIDRRHGRQRRSEGARESTEELHARLRKDIEDFNRFCEDREHTDIGDLWSLVGDIWEALGGVAGTLFDQPHDG